MDTVSWEDRDGARWIELEGEFDHNVYLEVHERFQEAVNQGQGDVVILMGGVTFLSSAGVGMLLHARSTLAERGRRLKLADLKPKVRKVFELMSLEGTFDELQT